MTRDAGRWSVVELPGNLRLRVAATGRGVRRLSLVSDNDEFAAELAARHPDVQWQRRDDDALLSMAARQLRQYFRGERRSFDLPLALTGTPFQRRVWSALLEIPYGETRSYREIAEALGSPGAVRAVGSANGKNPVPVIVPCHRVVGADGSLRGYRGGLEWKQRLLGLESRRRALGESAGSAA